MALRFAFGLLCLIGFVGAVGWFIWATIRRSEDPRGLTVRWILTVILIVAGYLTVDNLAGDGSEEGKIAGVLIGAVFGLIFAVLWVPTMAGKVGEWFGNLYTGGSEPPEPKPLYSVAESRRKQSRFPEAIGEIQAQLAKFPTDVIGQMMLAEIQADNLHDLAAAQLTIERFVAQPGHGPRNIAFALNSLADWQLKYNQDVEAARAAVQKIIDLTPDTESAMTAARRLAHLADAGAMAAVWERKPLQMRTGPLDLGLHPEAAVASRPEETPEAAADRLVLHLEAHPLDADAREELAQIYSDHYGRFDLAIDQLEQLVNAPHQPARDLPRWLNTMADYQVKHGADLATVQATLQRIIDLFPGLAAERLAQQRLAHLRLEFKGKESGPTLTLGTYEKDLGLKPKKPRGSGPEA